MSYLFNPPIVPTANPYSVESGSGLTQNGPVFGTKGLQRVMGTLPGAAFNTTADQAIAIAPPVSKWMLTSIAVTNAAGLFTLAVGGFYTGSGKTGITLVAATQVYTALTGGLALLPVGITAAALATVMTASQIYFSLTVPQLTNSTADLTVIGVDLS